MYYQKKRAPLRNNISIRAASRRDPGEERRIGMREETVLVETVGGMRALTLNRPEKLNSFNETMHIALQEALRDAAADPAHRSAGQAARGAADLAAGPAQAGDGVIIVEAWSRAAAAGATAS